MILHLLFHDKFEEYAIKHFSLPEMCSEIVVVLSSRTSYSNTTIPRTRYLYENSSEFEELLLELNRYNAIVFHGLFFPWQERVFECIPQSVKIAWVFWGGEIYGRKDIAKDYLSFSSKILLLKHRILHFIKYRTVSDKYEIPLNLLKRIDYCLTDIPEDFAFVKEYFQTDIKELWYNYYSVDETIGELKNARCYGNSILLGNSCSIECNHFDGFKAIRGMRLNVDTNVYVPLSYGEAWLRKEILLKGERILKKRFKPITTFLPRNEYNLIIQSCSVAIMPHYRPQAFGNILTALWLGTRVYLSKRNPLFSFFKRIGAIIFCIEDEPEVSLLPLTDAELIQNRSAISALYNAETMYKNNKLIVKTLDS